MTPHSLRCRLLHRHRRANRRRSNRTTIATRVIASITAFTELRIRQRLDQTLTIPPLPEATRRILELKADPDFNLRDLTRVVEADPSLVRPHHRLGELCVLRSTRTGEIDLRRDPARDGSAGDVEHGVGDCAAAGPQGAEGARARLVALLAAGDVHRGDDGNAVDARRRAESTVARLLLSRRVCSRTSAHSSSAMCSRRSTRRSAASRKRIDICHTRTSTNTCSAFRASCSRARCSRAGRCRRRCRDAVRFQYVAGSRRTERHVRQSTATDTSGPRNAGSVRSAEGSGGSLRCWRR